MITLRWTFHDPETDETYTVPKNPREMSDPEARQRKMQFGAASPSSHLVDTPAITRTFETRSEPVEWNFGGVIYTKEHHDALLAWSKVSNEVEISDHFGRTFEVMMKSFEPTERRPTPNKPWRFTYEMRALVLRRVS